jgi:hypothetical protein
MISGSPLALMYCALDSGYFVKLMILKCKINLLDIIKYMLGGWMID